MKSFLNLIIFFLPVVSLSQSVVKIGKTEVLLNLEGKTLENDQEFYIVDGQGKKKAQIKISAVNSKQAKAKIIKGKVQEIKVGMKLSERAMASVGETTMTESTTKISKTRNSWGVLGSYMMNSMNAKFSYSGTNQSAAMSGSGFGVLGYYDYSFNKDLQLRAASGLEQFSAKKKMDTAVCEKGATTECNVSISYLSFYGIGKYLLTKGNNKTWVGAGMGYLMAMSKSSTVLDTGLITSNQVLTLSFGVDVGMSANQLIPISFEYSLFPSSSTVSASVISLKVGFGFGL